jgi:hypothetical protein
LAAGEDRALHLSSLKKIVVAAAIGCMVANASSSLPESTLLIGSGSI